MKLLGGGIWARAQRGSWGCLARGNDAQSQKSRPIIHTHHTHTTHTTTPPHTTATPIHTHPTLDPPIHTTYTHIDTYMHTHMHAHTQRHTHTAPPPNSQAPLLAASGAVAPAVAGSSPPPLPPPPSFLPPFYIQLACVSPVSSFIDPWLPSKASRLWQLQRTKTWPEHLAAR